LFEAHQLCCQLWCALTSCPAWEVFEQRVCKCLGEEEIWSSMGQGKGNMSLNSMRQDQV